MARVTGSGTSAATAAAEAVRRGRAVVLQGAPGSGRSWTAREVAGRLRARGLQARELAGADGASGVPLAAFAPLLVSHGLAAGAASALDAYTRLPLLLAAETGTCLVVDDADRLDPASAILLGQLARAGVPIVVTVVDVELLPSALLDRVTSGGWEVLELGRAEPDAILALAAEHGGGELAAGAAAQLLARADGRPAVALALVASSRSAAQATPAGLEIGWIEPIPAAVRRWSIDPALLAPDQRRAAELVAVAELLPADLAVGVAGVDALLGSDLLAETEHGVCFRCRLDQDVVLAATSSAVRRARSGQAHRLLARAGAAWSARATLLGLRAGLAPAPADILAAAQDPTLESAAQGELLVAAPEDDARIHLLRGAAASAAERLDEAGVHLARAQELLEAAAPGRERDRWLRRLGQELGLMHAVRRGDPGAAVVAVTAVALQVDDSGSRELLSTELVKWRLMAGETDVDAPGRAAAEVDAAGVVGAAVIGAMIQSLDGARPAAVAEVERGLAALTDTTVAPPHAESLLELSRFLALVFDADLATAEALATARRDRAALQADPELGMWEYAAAELALHTGRLDDAAALAERAVRHLAWRDFTGLRATATALVMAVAGRRGRRTVPDVAVDQAASTDVKVDLHLARCAAEDGAVDRLVKAGRRAMTEMHGNLGVLALDDAWMLTRSPALAADLLPQAERGGIAELLASRVEAFSSGSAHALTAAAERMQAVGLHGRAADAWEQAARLHRESGRHDTAARASATATLLRSTHGLGSWPASAVVLSPRESEIAQLAARRVRSREIGELLGLSVRTVDNHLARAYRKLGVTGRDELVDLLGPER